MYDVSLDMMELSRTVVSEKIKSNGDLNE